jgi:nucleotide-binding universal stress UspA family protein
MMHKKILLAYNGSAHSEAAMRQAADLARLANAELHILGIVVTTGGLAMAQATGAIDVLDVERSRIQKAIEKAVRGLTEHNIKVHACIRQGDPANEIVAHARKIGADLVVLGHTDKGIITRWFQGSIGAKLLSNLPCSLLIATGKSGG